jgi:polysaccharide export outer membrane protein
MLWIAVVAITASATVSAGPPVLPVLDGCQAEYLIGLEDVLDIAVWGSAELTRTVPVRPDGKISLPLLNDVQAAGLAPMQLREQLTKSLASYIASPNVSVIVREIHSFKVTVIGEVKTPGRYELKSRATVLDLLAMAGGPTDYAARGRIVVLRQSGTSTRQIPFSYDGLTSKNEPKSGAKPGGRDNFCAEPGDIIFVP